MTMNGFEAERQLALAVWRTPTDPEGARRLFETVIQTAPDQPTYRLTFAHFLAHQHEWPAVQDQVAASATLDAERTLKWLQTKAEQNPDDPTWLHLHALLLARLGRDTQAAASFDRLLARPTVAGQVRVDYAALQAWQVDEARQFDQQRRLDRVFRDRLLLRPRATGEQGQRHQRHQQLDNHFLIAANA